MRKTLTALAPAVLLVAIAIWEIVATARARAAPDDSDWRRAEAAVREGFRPGDLVVFSPRWIDPVGRLHLGDLIRLDVAARMDAARFARIWEVSIRSARAPETRGLAPVAQETFGGVTVRRFEQTPAYVLADLVSLAATARASGAITHGPTVELTEVGFAPHRCVQIVPRPDGSATIDFGAVPLGSTLVGYAGLADVFTRRDVRDPGRLELDLDGVPLARLDLGIDDGWKRFQVDTPNGLHHLAIVVTAVGPNARDRRICFAAEARQ